MKFDKAASRSCYFEAPNFRSQTNWTLPKPGNSMGTFRFQFSVSIGLQVTNYIPFCQKRLQDRKRGNFSFDPDRSRSRFVILPIKNGESGKTELRLAVEVGPFPNPRIDLVSGSGQAEAFGTADFRARASRPKAYLDPETEEVLDSYEALTTATRAAAGIGGNRKVPEPISVHNLQSTIRFASLHNGVFLDFPPPPCYPYVGTANSYQ